MPAGQLRTDLLALADENGIPVEDVLVVRRLPADHRAQRLRLRLRLDPADRRLRHAARPAARRRGRVDRRARAGPRGHRRRAHRHADRRARRRRRGRRCSGGCSPGRGCCAGRAPTSAGDPRGGARCCCSSSPWARCCPRRCRTSCRRQVEARADVHALDLTERPGRVHRDAARPGRRPTSPTPTRPAPGSGSSARTPRSPQRIALAEDWARAAGARDAHAGRHQRLPAAAGRHPDVRRRAARAPPAGSAGRPRLPVARAGRSTTPSCLPGGPPARPAMLLPTPGDRARRRRARPPARLRQRVLRRRRAARAARPGPARRPACGTWSARPTGTRPAGWRCPAPGS